MRGLFLGVDTSNYTTSVSLLSESEVLFKKAPLFVRLGEKGVRQSEAVFQHTKNLPPLFDKIFAEAREKIGEDFEVAAVGVSEKPRRVEGSYMPCFLAGVSAAAAVASALGCPIERFSHQEGHIRAAVLGSGMDNNISHFYSFHLSGGTCELLEVSRLDNRYSTRIIAESADITLGQLIDRVGVMLGLQFPCGIEMEKLADKFGSLPDVKIKNSDKINLSGFENRCAKLFEDGKSQEEIAAYVFGVCIKAVKALLSNRLYPDLPVLFSGGVCSSYIIKNSISECCDAYFAPPVYSADNAIGIAALVRDKYCNGVL